MSTNTVSDKSVIVGIVGIVVAVIGFAALMNAYPAKSSPKNLTAKDFKAGECLVYINGAGYIYQVVQTGEYSLRVAKRTDDSIEDTMIFANDIQYNIQKADCFDLFKTGLPVK